MNSKLSLVWLVILGSAVASSDSEGTDFVFSFVRNADPNPNVPNQVLSITVLNGGSTNSCNLTVTYRETFEGPVSYKSVMVAPLSAVDIPIPSFYGFAYATVGGVQNQFLAHETLYAQSSCPVTVLANNYDNQTLQGETFTVFPKTFGGYAFSFSLPPVMMMEQYQQVTFLPTQGSANVNLRIPEIQASHQFAINDINGTSYIALKSSTKSQSITYHITSDAPIQIVAGVTCSGAIINSCDHICYMPQYIASAECYYDNVMRDDHVTELLDNQLYADISGSCQSAQTVILNNGNAAQENSVSGQQPSEPLVFDGSTAGAFYVEATTAAVHVSKYFDGSVRAIGSYITTVPSISQMISSSSYFYTRDPNSVMTISCSRMACSTIYMDGTLVFGTNFTYHGKLNIGSESYYVLAQTVVDPGFHTLSFREEAANKQYAYYIRSADNRYAYTGQINVPNVNITIPPTTTPGPTTTAKTVIPITQSTVKPMTTAKVVTTDKPITQATAKPMTTAKVVTTSKPITQATAKPMTTAKVVTTDKPITTQSPKSTTSANKGSPATSPSAATTKNIITTSPSKAPPASSSTIAPPPSSGTTKT
ncbi:unnamed protein product, partial [Auanema sp. JU1783]